MPSILLTPTSATDWPDATEQTFYYERELPALTMNGHTVFYLPHPHHYVAGKTHISVYLWDNWENVWNLVAHGPSTWEERERIASHATGRTLLNQTPEYGGETPDGCPTDWCNSLTWHMSHSTAVKIAWQTKVIPAMPPEPLLPELLYQKSTPNLDRTSMVVDVGVEAVVNLQELVSPYVWEVWRRKDKRGEGGFRGTATDTDPDTYGHPISWTNTAGQYILYARLEPGATTYALPTKRQWHRFRVYNLTTGARSPLSQVAFQLNKKSLQVMH